MKLELYLRDPCLGSPFSSLAKCEPVTAAATLGAAGIGAAANLLGNLLGFSSQSDVNETNLRIAQQNAELQRETNRQNYQIFQEQNAFTKQMWEANNRYNSPKENVQRLLNAGINPAAVYGSGSTTPASQIQSASAPNIQAPMVNYQKQGYFPDFRGIDTAASGYFQNRLLSTQANNIQRQTEGQEIENEFNRLSNPWRIKQLQSLAKRDDALGDIARLELNYSQAVQGQKISQMFNDTRLQMKNLKSLDVDIAGRELNNALMQVQLAYAPKLNDAQLQQYYSTVSQIRAQIGLINSNRLLTDQQRLSEIQKTVGQTIENGLRGLDYKLKDKTFEYSVAMAREQLYEKEDERFLKPFKSDYEFQGKAGQYFPMPSGQYGSWQLYERNQRRDAFRR